VKLTNAADNNKFHSQNSAIDKLSQSSRFSSSSTEYTERILMINLICGVVMCVFECVGCGTKTDRGTTQKWPLRKNE